MWLAWYSGGTVSMACRNLLRSSPPTLFALCYTCAKYYATELLTSSTSLPSCSSCDWLECLWRDCLLRKFFLLPLAGAYMAGLPISRTCSVNDGYTSAVHLRRMSSLESGKRLLARFSLITFSFSLLSVLVELDSCSANVAGSVMGITIGLPSSQSIRSYASYTNSSN